MPDVVTRYDDISPIKCNRCGWIGRIKDAIHTYQDDQCGDVEAVDECPICGTDDFEDYEDIPLKNDLMNLLKIRGVICKDIDLVQFIPDENSRFRLIVEGVMLDEQK